jgi:hypothetical protein
MSHLLDIETLPGRSRPWTGRRRCLPLYARFGVPAIFFAALLLLLAAGCRPIAVEPALTPVTVEGVPSPATEATLPPALQAPVLQAAPSPTVAPTVAPATPTVTPVEASPTPSPVASPVDLRYRVIFVADDDVLNVRTAPGVANPVAGELAPDAGDVIVSGPGELVTGSLWVPVVAGPVSGWVNSQFLTESVPGEAFCNDAAAEELVATFRAAVAARDGEGLAGLVHPDRGLRIHRHWWNPEVRVSRAEAADLFRGNQTYYWGVADGTGDEMRGPFSRYILPALERNLLPATETACNRILHGSTAGLVQLPEGYESANYYAVYRPAGEGVIEFDWGTWVIGIERWQGDYYLSFLVHFEWEI